MSRKEISEAYQIFNNQVMTGTTIVTSSVSGIQYRDSVALQLSWTGQPTGTFAVEGSIDYSQGMPQSGSQANPGTWTGVTLSPSPAAAGSGSFQILINMNQIAFPYIRVRYTNTTSSGVLSGWFFAKSLG